MGTLPCDDSNVVNFDGCSEACNVEAGYKCGGGNIVS
jgi:cysteine-rich repeat protein